MKLSVMQPRPSNAMPADILRAVDGWASAAAAQGSDLLLLPELLLPGYNRPDLHRQTATPLGGEWTRAMADIARRSGIAICHGWAERAGNDIYNAASVVAANGDLLAHYRKIQLFGAMERAGFAAGSDEPPIFDLAGRRAAILICYDIEFPEHARALARRGAQLLLVPTANPMGYPHVADLLVPARACENRIVVAYANYVGDDHGLQFGGGSIVAGPDGQALVRAGAAPAMLTVDLPDPVDDHAGQLSTQIADLRLPG